MLTCGFRMSAAGGNESSDTLIRVHAICMWLAWAFFAPVGVLAARYWRPEWPHYLPGGGRVWFQLHRVLLFCALACTIIGIAAIFGFIGFFADLSGAQLMVLRAHPIIGITVLVLAVLNPVIAYCRPVQDSRWRPVFNVLHTLIGRVMMILAIFNIFVGLQFYQASWINTQAVYNILYFLIAFHTLVEIVLSMVRRSAHKESIISPGCESEELMTPRNRSSILRRYLVYCYICVSLLLVFIFIAICSQSDTATGNG